ncbi:hypothetical protein ACWEOW_06330 [Monashia sp. NPDC004114]
MSNDSGDSGDTPGPTAPDEAQGRSTQQFTVPLPPTTATQPVPQQELTRALPLTPANPYAAQPGPYAAQPDSPEQVDPLLEKVGIALFWVTVGWWVFFLVRVLGYFVRFGGDATIIIRTIDRGAEETVIAAVLSVLAAVLLLFGRGSKGRTPLGYAAGVLAVVTVAVAVWRIVP